MLVEERADELGMPETPRRAFWPIAVLLFGLLVAALGAAFLLDQRYRPRVGVELIASPVAAQPTVVAQPTAAAAAPAPPTAVPTQQPTVAPTATVPPTVIPTAVATSAPVQATVAGAAAPPTPSNAADLLSPLEKEIVDSYLRYWAIRMQAYYDLDTSRLAEVMAGEELAREEKQVRELKAQGLGVRMDVEHDLRIVKAAPIEAVVYDEYVNRSLYIDPITKKEKPTKESPPTEKISYQMRKIDGVWKVVDGARHV